MFSWTVFLYMCFPIEKRAEFFQQIHKSFLIGANLAWHGKMSRFMQSASQQFNVHFLFLYADIFSPFLGLQ